MQPTRTTSPAEAIRDAIHPVTQHARDYDSLLDSIGEARIVCLGEATHGTDEFYRERARITRRLIEEKGFTAVAAEADWPDAYLVNRYVRGSGDAESADEALGGFKRFPTWMWRNTAVLEFVEWLRQRNQGVAPAGRAGFYGLDLYSLFGSIEAVLKYLDDVDPDAARRARYRYGCFDHYEEDSQAYGYAATFGMTESCEERAVEQLVELRRKAARATGDYVPEDELFQAEQNARVVANAEEYYRTMFSGRISSWNLRDRHMADTVEALLAHFDRRTGKRTRIVVWEHNSHVGDARATQMGDQGEWTVGQLLRERHGGDVRLVGFSTHHGTVTAASDWDRAPERKRVRPALEDSFESTFHEIEIPNFYLVLREGEEAAEALRERRLERAIGVVYLPRTERSSHYFRASLSQQFDAAIHFDETRAVVPLEPTEEWHAGEPPETYPTGL